MSELLPPTELGQESAVVINDTTPSRWPRLVATGIAAAAVLVSPTLNEQPAEATTSQAIVGMPFSGKWGYNAVVSPPYTDNNSSHPSVHAPYGSDWATDIYAGAGTDVRVYGSSPQGAVTFRRASTSDTCSSYGANIAGRGVTFDVLVNGTEVGEVKYDHLDLTDVGGSPIASGSKIGDVTSEPLNSSCFQTRHAHVQFRNTTGNYSCYVDHGTPGVTLNAGDNLGVLGSTNAGPKQACTSIPAGGGSTPPPPPPPPNLESSPVVANGTDLHIFGRGLDHEIYDKAWNGSGWNSLQRIQAGAVFEAGPTGVTYAGEVHLFGRGNDDEFYKNTLTSGGWTGFQRLEPGAIFVGEPVAVPHGMGLHVFGRGNDGQIYDKFWTGSGWNGTLPIAPGSVFESDPAVVSYGPELHLFARGTNDELYENTLLPTGWTGVQRLQPGSIFEGDPAVVEYAGELHLVARGLDHELYKNTRTSTGWTGFQRLEPGALFESDPDIDPLNGSLHIIARGNDDEVYDKAWNGSSWNSLQRIAPGSLFENDPVATAYAGELHLVNRGNDHELYKNTLTTTGWTGFQRLEPGGAFEGE